MGQRPAERSEGLTEVELGKHRPNWYIVNIGINR